MKVKYSIGIGSKEIILANVCAVCLGDGSGVGNSKPICSDCSGYGYTHTENGMQILAMVMEHLAKGKLE